MANRFEEWANGPGDPILFESRQLDGAFTLLSQARTTEEDWNLTEDYVDYPPREDTTGDTYQITTYFTEVEGTVNLLHTNPRKGIVESLLFERPPSDPSITDARWTIQSHRYYEEPAPKGIPSLNQLPSDLPIKRPEFRDGRVELPPERPDNLPQASEDLLGKYLKLPPGKFDQE